MEPFANRMSRSANGNVGCFVFKVIEASESDIACLAFANEAQNWIEFVIDTDTRFSPNQSYLFCLYFGLQDLPLFHPEHVQCFESNDTVFASAKLHDDVLSDLEWKLAPVEWHCDGCYVLTLNQSVTPSIFFSFFFLGYIVSHVEIRPADRDV